MEKLLWRISVFVKFRRFSKNFANTNKGVFLWILPNLYDRLFHKTPPVAASDTGAKWVNNRNRPGSGYQEAVNQIYLFLLVSIYFKISTWIGSYLPIRSYRIDVSSNQIKVTNWYCPVSFTFLNQLLLKCCAQMSFQFLHKVLPQPNIRHGFSKFIIS